MTRPNAESPFPAISPETWREQAERDLGRPLDRLRWRTDDGVVVEPLYTEPGVPVPGAARANHEMWRVEQAVDAGSIEQAASDAADVVTAGADRVVLRLDAAARSGADADAADAGDVDGIPVATALDLARLLSAGDLTERALRLEAGDGAFAATALLLAARRRDRLADADLNAVLGLDPLDHLARTGALHGSADDAVARAAELAAWCLEHAPHTVALLASSRAVHEAGGSAGQEIGWSVAVALTWLRALEALGVPPQHAARAIAIERCVGPAQFEEIAAMRATRAVWARVLEACGADADATLLARTSMRTHTTTDPWNNAIRATTQTFAAVSGGADAVLVEPWDALPGPAGSSGDRLARNTALVLRDESHIGHVRDPAAGSGFVEALTASLCEAGWAFFQDIERAGGPVTFLRSGALAAAIEPVATRRAADIASRRRGLTGVTEFPPAAGDASGGASAVARAELVLAIGEGLRGHRERFPATDELAALRGATGTARVDAAIAAAAAGATLAAIVDASARGDDERIAALPVRRDAAPYEALRARTQKQRPSAVLVGLGALAEHNARATWIANLLAVAGIPAALSAPVASADEAAAAAAGADLAVLCGTDERYAELAADAAGALRRAGCAHVAIAGRVEPWEALRDAGVATRLFAGADVLDLLTTLLDDLGVPR